MMQVTMPAIIGAKVAELARHPTAGPPTVAAVGHINELFGRRGQTGIRMAARALEGAIPEERVTAICVAYTAALRNAVATGGTD